MIRFFCYAHKQSLVLICHFVNQTKLRTDMVGGYGIEIREKHQQTPTVKGYQV